MNSFFAKMMGANDRVRPSRFAGTWYPSDPKVLENNLIDYLHESQSIAVNKHTAQKNIIAIIAPHAGYIYSGKTAAFAYGILNTNKYKRVFLLGPSHHIAFKGVAFSY